MKVIREEPRDRALWDNGRPYRDPQRSLTTPGAAMPDLVQDKSYPVKPGTNRCLRWAVWCISRVGSPRLLGSPKSMFGPVPMKPPKDTIVKLTVSAVSPRSTVVKRNGQKVKSILSQKENSWFGL